MTPPKIRPPVPAIALRESDAAAALDMGVTFFREHVMPDVRFIRIGQGAKQRKLYPVAELERWALANAETVL